MSQQQGGRGPAAGGGGAGRASSLIIADGGVACVVAAWIEGACRGGAAGGSAGVNEVGPVLWRPAGLSGAALAGVERLGERCHASAIVDSGVSGGGDGRGLGASALLLAAGEEAIARGIGRVIWPVQFGGELGDEGRLSAVSGALDRALLAGRLLSVDAARVGAGVGVGVGVVIETPVVELTDGQLLDLAGDTDAPLVCCGWQLMPEAGVGAGVGVGVGAGELARWQRAMNLAGIVPAIAGLGPEGAGVGAGA